MGKQLDNQLEKIVQRSIGFTLKQIMFFAKHPEFKPDKFCRVAVDEQISIIEPEFLENEN